jgi:hypothetical protein
MRRMDGGATLTSARLAGHPGGHQVARASQSRLDRVAGLVGAGRGFGWGRRFPPRGRKRALLLPSGPDQRPAALRLGRSTACSHGNAGFRRSDGASASQGGVRKMHGPGGLSRKTLARVQGVRTRDRQALVSSRRSRQGAGDRVRLPTRQIGHRLFGRHAAASFGRTSSSHAARLAPSAPVASPRAFTKS